MKLTFEQIRSITTGAVSLEQEEYGIRVYRFNEEQRSLFQRRIRLLAEKMQSAAGIQFFFRTIMHPRLTALTLCTLFIISCHPPAP